MGKPKLTESLKRAQVEGLVPTKKKSVQAPVKKHEDSDNEMEDSESEQEEEELKIDHPLSKKELRKLKKELKKQNKTLDDVLPHKDDEEEEAESEDEEAPKLVDTNKLVESDSESEIEMGDANDNNDSDSEEEEEEEEEDIPLSDAEFDDDDDVIPHQKLTVNNTKALLQALQSIQIPRKGLKFQELLSVNSSEPFTVRDVFDDLERELAFYKQGLEAAELARQQLKEEGLPFSRPTDYFAEMVKSDEHMEKLKQKLIAEETAKRAAQDARRQRELKKFGKKVQTAKLLERQKDKRETLEKIKSLKKRRAGNEMTSEDFDIAVEEATAANSEYNDSKNRKPNAKRQAKNDRYGFGGKKRFSKSNDATSSADVSDFNKRMKAKTKGSKVTKRPGKSKRQQRR